MAREDWTKGEIAGLTVNKAAQNRALQTTISRNRGAIEFKHQNISAVMLGLGQPWITGYKPLANFQNALVDGVLRWLDRHEDWLMPRSVSHRVAAGGGGQAPFRGPGEDRLLRYGTPPSQRNEPAPVDPDFMAALGRKFDVAARDARNRALGRAGEQAVFAEEQRVLLASGRADLARKARWTSQEDGDSYGYDIASFEPDGREKLIEVKTTNGWERTPFHISANELAVADARREEWQLVRVWDFARQPSAFVLRPPLQSHVDLTPTSFLAALN